MDTSIIIWFFVGVGVYLAGIAVFTIIKAVRNKKHFKKELKAKQDEEKQSQDSNA